MTAPASPLPRERPTAASSGQRQPAELENRRSWLASRLDRPGQHARMAATAPVLGDQAATLENLRRSSTPPPPRRSVLHSARSCRTRAPPDAAWAAAWDAAWDAAGDAAWPPPLGCRQDVAWECRPGRPLPPGRRPGRCLPAGAQPGLPLGRRLRRQAAWDAGTPPGRRQGRRLVARAAARPPPGIAARDALAPTVAQLQESARARGPGCPRPPREGGSHLEEPPPDRHAPSGAPPSSPRLSTARELSRPSGHPRRCQPSWPTRWSTCWPTSFLFRLPRDGLPRPPTPGQVAVGTGCSGATGDGDLVAPRHQPVDDLPCTIPGGAGPGSPPATGGRRPDALRRRPPGSSTSWPTRNKTGQLTRRTWRSVRPDTRSSHLPGGFPGNDHEAQLIWRRVHPR